MTMKPNGVKAMTALNFGSLEALNSVRNSVVSVATEIASEMVDSCVGFGFRCLDMDWEAKRGPINGKWEIFHGEEFFTDIKVVK